MAMLIAVVLAAVAFVVTPAGATGVASISMADCDADGRTDFTIDTTRYRARLLSSTGRLAEFYLKGRQFDENIVPPLLLDHGYRFPPDTLEFLGVTAFPQLPGAPNMAAASVTDRVVPYSISHTTNAQGEPVVTVVSAAPLTTTIPPPLAPIGPAALASLSLPIGSGSPLVAPTAGSGTTLVATAAIASLTIDPAAPKASGPLFTLTKQFTFHPDAYHFDAEITLTNVSKQPLAFGSDQNRQPGLSCGFGPGIFLDPFDANMFEALMADGNQQYTTAAELASAPAYTTIVGVGLATNYFCALLDAGEPIAPLARSFQFASDDARKRTFDGSVVAVGFRPFIMAPEASKTVRLRIFIGPKMLDELAPIKRERITSYGALSTMMLRVLQGFHWVFPNYGMAIIMLTLLVRLVLYPLTLQQTKSMAEMQKLQPLVQDLRDRYANNPQKMNEEMLKLYQRHNVNPVGGCLPMLLQLPVLIALYNTINAAVELRKVHFLWMTDLSKADPYMILPVAIVALMYYQQSTMKVDPAQQQMMNMMPMFMFVITWSLPAGVLIYWLTSSIIGLFQQFQAEKITRTIKEEHPS